MIGSRFRPGSEARTRFGEPPHRVAVFDYSQGLLTTAIADCRRPEGRFIAVNQTGGAIKTIGEVDRA
jgi:hypothetical protein